MKGFSLLLFILIILVSCTDKPVQGESMSLTGYELTELPGTDMQQAVFKDAKGRVMEQGTIRNKKKHGTWVVFHKERDVPKSIASYVDGVLYGAYFEYSPYGQLSLVSNYSNNKLHGHYAKYKSVRKAEEGNYVEGQVDGLLKKYYDGSEKVQQEISFKMGKQDGEHLFYNDNGEVTMRYTYKDGAKLDGEVIAAKEK